VEVREAARIEEGMFDRWWVRKNDQKFGTWGITGKTRKESTQMAKEDKVLIVASKVKAVYKKVGFRTSGDFAEALSKFMHQVLIAAAKNAKAEGVGTVKPRHLEGIQITQAEG
jgi:hypothetical protein